MSNLTRKLSFILVLLILFNLITPSAIPIAENLLEEALSIEGETLRKEERRAYTRELDPERELYRKLKQNDQSQEKVIDLTELKNNHSIDDEIAESLKNIYPDLQDLSTILNKIKGFVNRNNLTKDKKEEFINELVKGKTIDEIISKHIEENRRDDVNDIENDLAEKITDDIMNQALSGEPDDGRYIKEYTAPFTINRDNESINPSDGSLIYRYPIVNLPGINGLDVNLEAVYNSREAVMWGIVSSTTFNEKNNRMGIGWSWNLPVIEIDDEYDYDNPDMYLHLGDGAIYEICRRIIEDDSNLRNYPSKDIQLNYDRRNFSNEDMSSRYVLTEKDGKQTYFGRDGRLLGIRDRYGNTITFDHIMIKDHPVINRITDTLGRVIRITYRDDEVIVRTPDGERTELWLEKIYHAGKTYSKSTIETIVDPIRRKTE